MRVESITFLSPLEDVKDIFDYNMDIAVKLEDGHEYVVVGATQKNLLSLRRLLRRLFKHMQKMMHIA